MRFSKEISDEVREMQFHPQQKIESTPDGCATLEMPAQSIREARRFVLAYGKDAKVLAPPELVADLRSESEALTKNYSNRETESQKPQQRKGASSSP